MSTSRYSSRRPSSFSTSVAPLFGMVATVIVMTTVSSFADCCGGGGAGVGGMPSFEQFGKPRHLRLQIFPGEKNQRLEIFNRNTGVRLATVPIAAGAPASGITMPLGEDEDVTYTAQVVDESGSGNSASVRPPSSDPASGDPKKDCPKCSPAVESNTGGGPPKAVTKETLTDVCRPVGSGTASSTVPETPDNTADNTADEFVEGIAGSPVKPLPDPNIPPPDYSEEPPPPDGTEPPPPAPQLFPAMLESLRKMRGGAKVSISSSDFPAPPIVFSARHLSSLDLNDGEKFRRHFTTSYLSKLAYTVQPAVDSDNIPISGMVDIYRPGMISGAIMNQDGLVSMEAAGNGVNYVVNLVKIGFDQRWELQFTPVPLTALITISDAGIRSVIDGGGFVSPTIYWVFQTSIEPDGRKILNIGDLRVKDENHEQHTNVRCWQTVDPDGTRHTYHEDVRSKTIEEIIDWEDDENLVRGKVMHHGTWPNTTKHGWVMRTGPDYSGQPVFPAEQLYPGIPNSNLALLNFGGEANQVWKWSTNGMWEKTVVSPSIDAVVRHVEVLRPGGTASEPDEANSTNSFAVVEDINELALGPTRTKVTSINGTELSRTVSASTIEASVGAGVVRITDTQIRYPAGVQSMPTTSVTTTFSNRMGIAGAGHVVYLQSEDGTIEQSEGGTIPPNEGFL